MSKEIMSKAAFARRIGVSQASITRASKKTLAPAMTPQGKVDAGHAAASEYAAQAKSRKDATNMCAPGVELRYQEAVAFAQETGIWTAAHIERGLGIPRDRARKIMTTARAAGVVPKPGEEPAAKAPPPPQDTTRSGKVRGWHAKRQAEQLKSGELDPLDIIPDDIRGLLGWTLQDLIKRFGTDVGLVEWLKSTKVIEDIHEKRLKNAQTEGSLVCRETMEKYVLSHVETFFVRLLADGKKTIAQRAFNEAKAGGELPELEKLVSEELEGFIKPVKTRIARALRDV